MNVNFEDLRKNCPYNDGYGTNKEWCRSKRNGDHCKEEFCPFNVDRKIKPKRFKCEKCTDYIIIDNHTFVCGLDKSKIVMTWYMLPDVDYGWCSNETMK